MQFFSRQQDNYYSRALLVPKTMFARIPKSIVSEMARLPKLSRRIWRKELRQKPVRLPIAWSAAD